MNWLELLNLGLNIVEMVLQNIPNTELPQEQIDNAKAALAKLREVQGTPVTKAQLDSLRG